MMSKIRASEITQNCFIFDETELLMVNNENGKGATFSSTEILGISRNSYFQIFGKIQQKLKLLQT